MNVNLFFSCSTGYFRFMLVALWSAILEKSPKTEYTVFLFCRKTSDKERELLYEMERYCPKQVKIVFRDMEETILSHRLPMEVQAGQETALCLLAGDLLPEVDRVLALDADIIVKKELAPLFSMPLDGALLAGVKDFDFIGRYNSQGGEYQEEYVHRLNLREPYSYVQGGVLLLDLEQMRKMFPRGALFKEFCQEEFKYDEQDFLNWKFEGKKKAIDARWNVLHDNCGYRKRYVIDLAPKVCLQEYEESRKEPWVIHYAGTDKPWENDMCDYAEEFWNVVYTMPPTLRIERPAPRKEFGLKGTMRLMKHEMMRAWQMHRRLKD